MRHLSSLIFLAFLFSPSFAIYFYFDRPGLSKCFIEEVPSGTIVSGAFRVEEWSDTQQEYMHNDEIGVQISAEEVSEHRNVLNLKSGTMGRFVFTAHESGSHLVCFSTNSTSWSKNHRLRFHIDMTSGRAGPLADTEEAEKDALQMMVSRIRDLNNRVNDIRREQGYQREREVEFRDMSEATNSRVVTWAIVQIIVLGITCLWQMRSMHGFFVSKKLV
ncbi:uncharacterized protein VTP21DRAFT_5681 [Calcarisporiella thermophila]|uniref:uncharacterized protein n=1 Tax=Calcarisporiella thermophila TaxID=911321 RepID=UPI003742D389